MKVRGIVVGGRQVPGEGTIELHIELQFIDAKFFPIGRTVILSRDELDLTLEARSEAEK